MMTREGVDLRSSRYGSTSTVNKGHPVPDKGLGGGLRGMLACHQSQAGPYADVATKKDNGHGEGSRNCTAAPDRHELSGANKLSTHLQHTLSRNPEGEGGKAAPHVPTAHAQFKAVPADVKRLNQRPSADTGPLMSRKSYLKKELHNIEKEIAEAKRTGSIEVKALKKQQYQMYQEYVSIKEALNG